MSESDTFKQDYRHNKDSEKVQTLSGTVLAAAIPYASQTIVSYLITNRANVYARQV